MISIGGYFELEISRRGSVFHDKAIALNTGRNAFEYIVLCKNIDHIYLPYFTCDVLLQPLKKHNINYSFYDLDSNFLPIIPHAKENDTLLYTNYFGLMHNQIKMLNEKKIRLIIDNAQAFYDIPLSDVPTFYSPRKFFGLPDGGFVYYSNEINIDIFDRDNSLSRISHLVTRLELGPEKGYLQFKENDNSLDNQMIKKMSNLTMQLLGGVDFEFVRKKRISNFIFLHNSLKSINLLELFIDTCFIECPMIYPLLIETDKLKSYLINHKIYIPTYWPNVLKNSPENGYSYFLAKNLVCIPIDQRYNQDDMNQIIKLIHNVIN